MKNKIALAVINKHFPRVKTIKNAKKGIYLTVTKKDSDEASKKDPNDCALARACKRQLKADGAIIRIHTSYVIKGNTAIKYFTSSAVGREITSFDRGSGFEEGHNYRLSPVPASEDGKSHGAPPTRPTKRDSSRSGKHIVHRTENIRVAERS